MKSGIVGIVVGISALLTTVTSFPNHFESQIWSQIPSSFGKIWSYYDFEVEEEGESVVLNNSSFCQCRSLCFVKNCSTLSMKIISPKDEVTRVECRLTSLPIHNLTFHPAEETISEAREKSFELFHGHDGVFYDQQMKRARLRLFEAYQLCRTNYHNGRFPILKTFEQYDSYWNFREINNLVEENTCSYLNMVFNKTNQKYEWSDGTPFEETEIYSHVQFVSTYNPEEHCVEACFTQNKKIFKLCEMNSDGGMAICQIDPFKNN